MERKRSAQSTGNSPNGWRGAAFQDFVRAGVELHGVAAGGGLAINFHALLRRADDPAFRHAGFRVEEGFDVFYFEGGDGDFDDEFGGGGVGLAESGAVSLHDAEIGFEFGITGSQRALAAQTQTGAWLAAEEVTATIPGRNTSCSQSNCTDYAGCFYHDNFAFSLLFAISVKSSWQKRHRELSSAHLNPAPTAPPGIIRAAPLSGRSPLFQE